MEIRIHVAEASLPTGWIVVESPDDRIDEHSFAGWIELLHVLSVALGAMSTNG